MKHTPTPWVMNGYDNEQYFYCQGLDSVGGVPCIAMPNDPVYGELVFMEKQDAEFMLHACNSYDALVAALEYALQVAKDNEEWTVSHDPNIDESYDLLASLKETP